MSDREPRYSSSWARTFWILFGLLVGLVVIGYVALETLAPGAVLGNG